MNEHYGAMNLKDLHSLPLCISNVASGPRMFLFSTYVLTYLEMMTLYILRDVVTFTVLRDSLKWELKYTITVINVN